MEYTDDEFKNFVHQKSQVAGAEVALDLLTERFGPTSHEVQQAAEHLGKSKAALERIETIAQETGDDPE